MTSLGSTQRIATQVESVEQIPVDAERARVVSDAAGALACARRLSDVTAQFRAQTDALVADDV